MGLRHPVGGTTAGAVGVTYRVAKTHRMPGGAESGGALFPQPAARHRGRTMAEFPRIIAIPFPILFPTFFEIERLQTSNFKSDV